MARPHPLRRKSSPRPPISSTIPGAPSAAPPSRRSASTQKPTGQPKAWGRRILRWALILFLIPVAAAGFLWLAAPATPATFLILGVDQRSDEAGPTRTDVIVAAHTDPAQNRAVLMSFPRDLWLEQPSGNANRINTAAFVGYAADDPHAGPRYLAQTLQRNFDIATQGYLLVNFDGFTRIVDAAGGVDVDVRSPIVDTQYPTADYGVTTIRFEAGPQHLDGEQALIYVRTRHQDSDFGRAARQQQVIQGLAKALLLPAGWLRIPGVAGAVLSATQSDLTPADYPALAQLALFLATGRVESVVLGNDYTTPWTTPNGAYVLLPNWDAILPQVDALLR